MSESYEILVDKEKIDTGLLIDAGYTLPEIMLALNTSVPFAVFGDGAVTAECLAADKNYYMDITHVAFRTEDDLALLLTRIAEHCRKDGKAYIEIGCGNANIELYMLYQRAGFRVVGVKADYYLDDSKTVNVLNSIPNIDMIRFRANLRGKRLATIGYDASGRT